MTTSQLNDTFGNLIRAAQPLFAARGFYGTSISSLAGSVSIAKSTLLHHFATKEKLYGAVLKIIAAEMTDEVRAIRRNFTDEVEQIHQVVTLLCLNSKSKMDRDIIILREMLDNPKRLGKSKKWYFADYLDELMQIIQSGYIKGRFKKTNPGAFILHLLGAHHYFMISLPTVKQLLDPQIYQTLIAEHEAELHAMVQERLILETVAGEKNE